MPPDTTDHPTSLGNYDVVSKIAEGGMGTVYKARHRGTGEIVAIKVISAGPSRNPVTLQRFEREFQAARVLDHPNVVRAVEYCGVGPYPFLVMEFVDGESLGQRVERVGAIAEASALDLIAQVCDGLQRAHKQGLVHRDVKPDNVLVTKEGVAKLTDMGLVKEVENDLNLTRTGRGLGTPFYMAPEQFRNAKGVDARGDIYSLGATLYCLVTGVVPFNNSNPLDCWMKKIRNEFPAPKELKPELSDRVDWAIRRAMSAEPAQRPASCREFLEDLTGQSRGSGTVKPAAGAPVEMWYLVYKDETGVAHTVKGTTENIRGALKDELLGDASIILVGRSKTGQFLPLGTVPEFRDLVVNPAALPPSGKPRPPGPAAKPGSGRVSADDAVDFGVLPPGTGAETARAKASTTGRTPGPKSDRYAMNPPIDRPTPPSTPRPATPAARPPRAPDPNAETPPQGHPPAARAATGRSGGKPPVAKKPFDWTPILMFLVAVLSAVVGYFLLTR